MLSKTILKTITPTLANGTRFYASGSIYPPLEDVYPADRKNLILREMNHNRFDRSKMKGKIALEEHFSVPDLIGDSKKYFMPDIWEKFKSELFNLGEQRLENMDKNGIQYSILSMTCNGCNAIWDREKSVATAKRINDHVAEAVKRHPDRFGAFATLPMQDPDAAIKELERCVRDLKFNGILTNGFSQVDTPTNQVYLDDPRYDQLWSAMESLGVPIYLHPRNPLDSQSEFIKGHPWLMGPAWAFSVETGTHALRLIGGGVFDRHPNARVILGHLGELVTNNIWRTNHWASRQGKNPAGGTGDYVKAKLPFMEYYRNNFFVTTSGNFRTIALQNAMMEIGVDKVLFSCDYPYETMEDACEWFDGCEINETDRLRIGRENSKKLFKLHHLDEC